MPRQIAGMHQPKLGYALELRGAIYRCGRHIHVCVYGYIAGGSNAAGWLRPIWFRLFRRTGMALGVHPDKCIDIVCVIACGLNHLGQLKLAGMGVC